MSVNITIQEGGVAKQLTVDKLKTNEVGGGTCLWIPEDEALLGTLNVTENGTFKANEYGYYGFSEVNVNGIGIASGKVTSTSNVPSQSDIDVGKEFAATQDANGNLTFSELPTSIEITTEPTYTTFQDGATIDFTGMVVKAAVKVSESGGGSASEYWDNPAYPDGIIPMSELIFPVTKADIEQVTESEYTDGNGINALLADCSTVAIWHFLVFGQWQESTEGYVYDKALGYDQNGHPVTILKNDGYGATYLTRYNNIVYAANATGNRQVNQATDSENPERDYGWHYTASWGGAAGDGVFVATPHGWTELPESTVNPDGKTIDGLHNIGGKQAIPVQWHRPIDGKLLETTLYITVAPGYEGDEGEGNGSDILPSL